MYATYFNNPKLGSGIAKLYTLTLILGKCVATLRGMFWACFSMKHAFFKEIYYAKRKKKLLICKLIALFIFISYIITMLVILLPKNESLEIVDSNCYSSYNDYYNETDCEMDVTFNQKVESGNIRVAFYDIYDNILEVKTIYFYGYGEETLNNTFITVEGNVYAYDIVDYSDITTYKNTSPYLYLSIGGGLVLFAFLLPLILGSCKVYSYEQYTIIIYAGIYYHYLKINNEKVDEYNTTLYLSAISLSTTLNTGEIIQAKISPSNRITLKINDKLYNVK